MYNTSKINIVNKDDFSTKTLLESVHNHLHLNASQLFFPIFQHLNCNLEDEDNLTSEMYKNKIFNSKYKCTEILGIVDNSYDVSDDESLDSASALKYNNYFSSDEYNNIDDYDYEKNDNLQLEAESGDDNSEWTSEEDDDGIMARNFEPNNIDTMYRYGFIDSNISTSSENPILDDNTASNEEQTEANKFESHQIIDNDDGDDIPDDGDGDDDGDDIPDDEYIPEDILNEDIDIDSLFEDGIVKYTDELKLRDIFANDNHLVNNCVVLCKISKNNVSSEDALSKIFIKKSPLLEPPKLARGIYSISNNGLSLPDIINLNTATKLNNINNAAHVEAIFLYLGNKLVEEGKTIAFPYYYGCVNAIDPNFHALINDEYEDIAETDWFQSRIATDLKLVIVDDNGNIVKGNNSSIKSKNPMAKLAKEMGVELPSSDASNHDDIVDLDTLDMDTESFSHLRKKDKSELNYFLNIPNMPVNIVLMEYMEETLDDMLTNGYNFNEVEWQIGRAHV